MADVWEILFLHRPFNLLRAEYAVTRRFLAGSGALKQCSCIENSENSGRVGIISLLGANAGASLDIIDVSYIIKLGQCGHRRVICVSDVTKGVARLNCDQ